MRITILLAALMLAGCAPSVTGNEIGGVVMHAGGNAGQALAVAQTHCQAYGKSARITGVTFQDYSGDPVTFECVGH